MDKMMSADGNSNCQNTKIAEIILLDECPAEEEPVLFCQDKNPDFSKYASTIRVYASHQGLDGSVIEDIQKSGFVPEDLQALHEAAYGQNLLLVKMKYDLLLAAICLAGAAVLWNRRYSC